MGSRGRDARGARWPDSGSGGVERRIRRGLAPPTSRETARSTSRGSTGGLNRASNCDEGARWWSSSWVETRSIDGSALVKVTSKAVARVSPESAFVPDGTVTAYSVAKGRCSSGTNMSALVPIQRQTPFGTRPSPRARMPDRPATAHPVSATSSDRKGRLKSTVTSVGSTVSPRGAAKTTANASADAAGGFSWAISKDRWGVSAGFPAHRSERPTRITRKPSERGIGEVKAFHVPS